MIGFIFQTSTDDCQRDLILHDSICCKIAINDFVCFDKYPSLLQVFCSLVSMLFVPLQKGLSVIGSPTGFSLSASFGLSVQKILQTFCSRGTTLVPLCREYRTKRISAQISGTVFKHFDPGRTGSSVNV